MEYWESRQISLELEKVKKGELPIAEERAVPDSNRSPTAQSLPQSNVTDIPAANPQQKIPKPHCTNNQVQNLNVEGAVHRGSIRKTNFRSLPQSNVTTISAANPSQDNPKPHCKNNQAQNLNVEGAVHRGSIRKVDFDLTSEQQSKDEQIATVREIHSQDSPGKPHAPIDALTFHTLVPTELERGFYIEMGGYELVPDKIDLPLDFSGRVTSRGAIELFRFGQLPEVPLELIKDQSKTDVLAKVFVCIQASWMIVQCIARSVQALPLTLLEIHTIMHVMCALLMSGLWIKKPHDLIIPTKIPVDGKKLKKLQEIMDANPPEPFNERGVVSGGLKLTEPSNNKAGAVDLGSCRTSQYENGVTYGGVLGLFISTIYGGVHLTVWNGHFPTYLERAFWRISGIIILGMPFFLVTFLLLIWAVQKQFVKRSGDGTGFWWRSRNGTRTYQPAGQYLNPKESSSYWRAQYSPHVAFLKYLKQYNKWGWYVTYMLLIILQIIASICYGLARAYLVFEAFAGLRNLPVGSYNAVKWTSFIPHF